jgi:hypothetical protein
MFTLQASQFTAQLNDAGMNPRVTEILMAMLGNCIAPLEHRGPITISTDFPNALYNVGDTANDDYPAASFTSRGGGSLDPNTNQVKGGFAHRFDGPVFFGGPIFGPGAGGIKLAKAQTNWKKSLPGISLVPVKETLSLGGIQEVGPVFDLYLPHANQGDPNVIAGNVLAYGLHNGVAVCLSPYMDDKIGTVKLWALEAAKVPAGWKIMDGTSNASVGSGFDMEGRFAKGADGDAAAGGDHDLGATGGSTSYTPEISGSGTIGGTVNTSTETDTFTTSSSTYPDTPAVGSPNYGGAVSVDTTISWTATPIETDASSNWTGTLKTDNTSNVNWLDTLQTVTTTGVPSSTVNVDTGGTSVATSDHSHEIPLTSLLHHHDISAAALGHQHAIQTTELAHTHTIAESSLDHSHTISNLAHYHTGTTDGHYHTVTIDADDMTFSGTEATIIPPFRNLYYIERIDNSV